MVVATVFIVVTGVVIAITSRDVDITTTGAAAADVATTSVAQDAAGWGMVCCLLDDEL